MPSIIISLVFLFLSNFLIEPTTCAVPEFLQNLELDDVTSLWDKFPAIIDKIKEAVNRFRCPKGWRRLGGSCYYLSNITSTPSEANQTCNLLHSNHSNLIQIRNTVELFYAAHVLTKNNLSALMIDIDPGLLKGKTMADILMHDQGRWRRMKDKFREVRVRYYKLKEKILNELNEAGLRISRRSKKVKQSVKKQKQKFTHDHDDPDVYDDYDYHREQNTTDLILSNGTTVVDEYEYDDLDSPDEGDEFEQIEDIRGICDQIDWNVINNDSTVYILTTYLISDQIVCSLSNVESDIEYEHVCEYVLDFCFANIVCGKNGRCVNTLAGFKCSCSFLYGGLLCERISKQGKQIIIGVLIILFLYGLSFKPIRWVLVVIIKGLMSFCKYYCKAHQQKKKKIKDDKQKLVPDKKKDEIDNKNGDDDEIQQPQYDIQDRRQTIAQEIMEFIRELYHCLTLPKNVDPLRNPNKRDLVRLCWVGGLSISFLILLFSVTTITHFTSFKYDITDDTKLDLLVNETLRLVTHCERISNYRVGNLIFFPIAACLILIFSWSVKREKRCLSLCDGRPGLIPPIEPFRTANRFTTATVFGILAFEVLKIFEELLFSTGDPLNHGVLIELLERIAVVILVGLRYYPVLASLQLRNIVPRFFVCLYVLGDIIYAIIREGSCMGFLPLSSYYSVLEEAKLRMELGTWFIIYGLIKNTPHFIFLSYIGAEVCVRFGYDSIYVPIKKKQSIWLSPVVQPDESEFAKYYVKKLFRRNLPSQRKIYSTAVNIDKLQDHEHEAELQAKANQTRLKKFFNSIYHWDEDFRFTTMATCTYTVAIVFLYYLACTFVFLYISRTTGHIAFLKFYVETTLNIEFQGFFSFKLEIIASAILTVMLYAFQLYVGMQNYKKHRKDLYKGIYEDVPSAANFKPNAIAAKSVHYSGFLVGYMAWGFVICFHLILFILSFIRIISLQIRYIEVILAVTVPVLVVYLLKMVSTSSAGKFFFIQDNDEKLNLKNRKTYAIFVYFNFFADCFLGIASCIIRLIKATFLNVVYMARLDCSFLGRPLEKFDLGFAAYVSYLHMEVTHTNPIMLAFCYSLYEDVVKKRAKGYDDECCIAPGELDDDAMIIEEKPKVNVSSKTRNQNGGNGTLSKKTKVHAGEIVSPTKSVMEKQNSIADDDDDDDEGPFIKEIKPKKKSPSPSANSEKGGSQKSKQQKLSIDDDIDEEQEDDGGPPTPVISTVARLIPQHQPMSPPPSAPPMPQVPIRKDLPPEDHGNEDNFDDDGGIKPPSISTISEIMPQQAPRLLPIQRSSPPPVPRRQDLIADEDDDDDGGMNPKIIAKQKQQLEEKKKKKQSSRVDDEDDDDDGGINPKIIAKQKQEREEKKKKSEEAKKKKQSNRVDEDDEDDGGISKIKQHDKIKPDKTKKKPIPPQNLDDEDDDGGVSKQKRIAAEKSKQASEAKKKEKEQRQAKANQDNDDDDDGAPKRHESTQKPKPIKKVPKTEILKEEDEDDDGGRIAKTYDTVRMIMPNKRPIIDNKNKKQPSPEATDDGSMLTSVHQQQQPLLASYDTVGRMVPKISTDFRRTKEENHYDTIPTEEERVARGNAIYSPPSYDQASNSNDLYLLRTISYREAQQNTPPLLQRRPTGSSSIHSHSNTNEDSSHYSEITNDTGPSGVINRSYSHTGSIQSSSNHSIKQQSKQASPQALKEEQQTEESTVESDQDEEEDEEEGEEEKQAQDKPLRAKKASLPNVSTAYSTLNYLVNPEEALRLEKIKKQKQARFRWFLAYTILNNYHLFDLRKQAQSRLALLRIQRSNPIDEQQQQAAAAASPIPQSMPLPDIPESPSIRHRKIEITTPTPGIPASPRQQPAITNRLLSVAVPVADNFPQSPAERYITIRSCMLYDVNAQQANTPRSQAPSNASQQVFTKSNLMTKSGGILHLPNVVIQPPSESSTQSKEKRPSYQRQASQHSTPMILNPFDGTPNFQGISESNQSTGDYPITNGSSITNFSTLRTQMSHAQHMQAYRQNELKKIQKKRPHCYIYGPPPQRPLEEKVATAAILTPQIIPPDDNPQRLPSNSPFQYPRQDNTINEKMKKNQEKRINSTTDTTNQDKSIQKKFLRTSSAIVHRKDSPSSFSNVTEV